MNSPLQPLPEDWERADAVIDAHPDDSERGTGAAAAAWAPRGQGVRYILGSWDEAGIDTLSPGDPAPLRQDEQNSAADDVGAASVTFLDHHPYGHIQEDAPTR